jgi:hypothetical protein
MAFSMEPEERGGKRRFGRLALWLLISLALILAIASGYVGYLSGRNAMAPQVTAAYAAGRAGAGDRLTPPPTYTPYPTYTPPPTLQPVVITATASPTPEVDVEATRAAATAQGDGTLLPPSLTEPKEDGFYIVGEEIAPGVWRSSPGLEDCHWARYNASNNLLGEYEGISGGVIRIRDTDYIVMLDGCGTWTYLGPEGS